MELCVAHEVAVAVMTVLVVAYRLCVAPLVAEELSEGEPLTLPLGSPLPVPWAEEALGRLELLPQLEADAVNEGDRVADAQEEEDAVTVAQDVGLCIGVAERVMVAQPESEALLAPERLARAGEGDWEGDPVGDGENRVDTLRINEPVAGIEGGTLCVETTVGEAQGDAEGLKVGVCVTLTLALLQELGVLLVVTHVEAEKKVVADREADNVAVTVRLALKLWGSVARNESVALPPVGERVLLVLPQLLPLELLLALNVEEGQGEDEPDSVGAPLPLEHVVDEALNEVDEVAHADALPMPMPNGEPEGD